MNWVDLALLAVLLISGLIGLSRGFVREVLGLIAWVAASYLAFRMRGQFSAPIGSVVGKEFAEPASFVAVFVVALIVFSIVAGVVGKMARGSVLGGVDRTLGFLFGIARGVVLLFAAYAVGGMLVPSDRWPPDIAASRALPYLYRGALWAMEYMPSEYRPAIAPPPTPRAMRPEDLFQANPTGRAVPTGRT